VQGPQQHISSMARSEMENFMGKLVLGIAAAAALMVAVAAWVPRGPMNHGWDWPWHDWWHSGLAQHGWFHQDCRTVTQQQRLPDGQVITRTIESC